MFCVKRCSLRLFNNEQLGVESDIRNFYLLRKSSFTRKRRRRIVN
jgi:hypothetical protein